MGVKVSQKWHREYRVFVVWIKVSVSAPQDPSWNPQSYTRKFSAIHDLMSKTFKLLYTLKSHQLALSERQAWVCTHQMKSPLFVCKIVSVLWFVLNPAWKFSKMKQLFRKEVRWTLDCTYQEWYKYPRMFLQKGPSEGNHSRWLEAYIQRK